MLGKSGPTMKLDQVKFQLMVPPIKQLPLVHLGTSGTNFIKIDIVDLSIKRYTRVMYTAACTLPG